MSKKTGYLLGILLTIIIGMLLMWFFCCGSGATSEIIDKSDQNNQVVVTEELTPTQMRFSIKDPDGNFSFSDKRNLDFNTSGFSILQPVSGAVNNGIQELQTYLNAPGNNGKFVGITGYYDTDEANNSAFPNLGLARADAAKNYFVSKGIPSSRVNTFGALRASLVPDGTIYRGPLSYAISKPANSDDGSQALADLKARINADPLVLYFNTAQSSLAISTKQRQKIADIKTYLDKIPDATLSIVGHTDNTGSRATNIPLGLNRANFAKDYFARNGIANSKINTSSKGPDNPIANNGTQDGRAKNRRCVVTLN